jgi:hypothetical protein
MGSSNLSSNFYKLARQETNLDVNYKKHMTQLHEL